MEGNKYVVSWALGHLVELADPQDYDKRLETWDMQDLPMLPDKMQLKVISQTAKQYKLVKSLLHRGDIRDIVIATDAGREGELVDVYKRQPLVRICGFPLPCRQS